MVILNEHLFYNKQLSW